MKFAAFVFYLLAFVVASGSIAFALTLIDSAASAEGATVRFLHHLLTYSWPAGLVITGLLWLFVRRATNRVSTK